MTPLPVHLEANTSAATAFLIIGVIFFCVSLFLSIRESRRAGSWLPGLALIGGGIASFAEAWIDVIIQLWYPLNSPAILFTGLGIPQPIFVHLVYPGFVGLGAYATYKFLRNSDKPHMLWAIFLAVILMDIAFECFATWTGVYYYYGRHAFQLFEHGWPAWVGPVNAAGAIAGGFLIYLLEPVMKGSQRVLIALLPPIGYVGVYGAVGWPSSTMMNSDVNTALLWVGATSSICLSVAIVYFVQQVHKVKISGQ